MKKAILLISVFAAVLSACKTVDLEQQETANNQPITIVASREGDTPETRTVRDENNGKILWTPGDRISLFYGSGTDGGSMFTSQATTNAAVTNFTGTIGVITGGADVSVDQTYFWGLYPYDETASCDGSSITTTLPAYQVATPGSFAPNTFLSVGRSPGLNMAFYNICGGLMIRVQKEGVRKVTLHSNDGPIAGKARIVLDDSGIPSVAEIIDGSDDIVLEAPEGEYLEPGVNYYFVTFPHVFTDHYFTLTFETYTEIGTYERRRAFTISRSNFESFSVAIDSNVTYELKEGNIPVPDPVFKAWLAANCDQNSDGEISYQEAGLIHAINIYPSNDFNLKSLRGIECMPNLEEIICYGDWYEQYPKTDGIDKPYYYVGPYSEKWEIAWGPIGTLEYINVTNNHILRTLNIGNNSALGVKMGGIDLSRNPMLEELRLHMTWLEYPDISNNNSLRYIDFSHLRGTMPDFSTLPELRELNIEYPQDAVNIQSNDIDVSGSPYLEFLCVSEAARSLSDLSYNSKLRELHWTYCPDVDPVDLSVLPDLEILGVLGCNLSSLDVSNNTKLTILFAGDNHLTSLSVADNPNLVHLHCYHNQLNSLDVSHNPALETLECWENSLSQINFSNNPSLRILNAANNNLTSIDFSYNPLLEELWIDGNNLTAIDVSLQSNLTRLNCWNNLLTSLDVTHNPALTMLRCWNNRISSLDVSKNLLLGTCEEEFTGLWCCQEEDGNGHNYLTTLYVAENQVIPFVTENRSDEHIPVTTVIQIAPNSGENEGSGEHQNEP